MTPATMWPALASTTRRVVQEGRRLAAVTVGTPSGQALVVQVVQERRQQLLCGRQPSIEISPELVGHLLAIRPGDLGEYLVEIARPHLAHSWLDRVVPSRRPATAVRVAAPPDVEPPRRAAGR